MLFFAHAVGREDMDIASSAHLSKGISILRVSACVDGILVAERWQQTLKRVAPGTQRGVRRRGGTSASAHQTAARGGDGAYRRCSAFVVACCSSAARCSAWRRHIISGLLLSSGASLRLGRFAWDEQWRRTRIISALN